MKTEQKDSLTWTDMLVYCCLFVIVSGIILLGWNFVLAPLTGLVELNLLQVMTARFILLTTFGRV